MVLLLVLNTECDLVIAKACNSRWLLDHFPGPCLWRAELSMGLKALAPENLWKFVILKGLKINRSGISVQSAENGNIMSM